MDSFYFIFPCEWTLTFFLSIPYNILLKTGLFEYYSMTVLEIKV